MELFGKLSKENLCECLTLCSKTSRVASLAGILRSAAPLTEPVLEGNR